MSDDGISWYDRAKAFAKRALEETSQAQAVKKVGENVSLEEYEPQAKRVPNTVASDKQTMVQPKARMDYENRNKEWSEQWERQHQQAPVTANPQTHGDGMGGRALRNQAEPEEEYEMDDDGTVRPVREREKNLGNLGDRIAGAPAEYMREHGYVLSPLQQQQGDAMVNQARLKATMFAAPKLFAMKQNIAQNIPGAQALAETLAPKTRSPYQMEREFSSEEEKQAYIEKVRQAMTNAAKK